MKGVARLKRYYRKINDYLYPKAVILMYHRVANLVDYHIPILVAPDHFRQQMAVLRRAYHPVMLDELIEAVKHGSIPRGAVAVTFDDGYADNYLHALPILEEFQIPATIFVSSGYINGDREYWPDELERIFYSPKRLPMSLEISIQGREYFWNLESMEECHTLNKEFFKLFKPLPPEEREKLMETLAHWAGIDRKGRAEHRSLTTNELKQLASNSLIQIGGHTVHHPQLSALSIDLQTKEIMDNRKDLEIAIDKSVSIFSYPFGQEDDFSVDTIKVVQEAGFKAACSTHHARIGYGSDLYRLPRYWVGDWSGDDFKKQIAGFFQG